MGYDKSFFFPACSDIATTGYVEAFQAHVDKPVSLAILAKRVCDQTVSDPTRSFHPFLERFFPGELNLTPSHMVNADYWVLNPTSCLMHNGFSVPTRSVVAMAQYRGTYSIVLPGLPYREDELRGRSPPRLDW